ncbi:MAG: GTPase, partial [Myxococcota bacterium]
MTIPVVALIGRPNVGKSSLLNALLGEERNIVADEPGTTRDATDSFLRVEGREVVLVDTAGMRKPGRRADRLERGSALMALRSLERADVGLLVLDAETGVSEQDAKIARLALDRGRPLVLVLEDLQSADPPSLRLLEHLAFEAADEPILVLASVREEFRERGHPLDRTLGVLRQQPRTLDVALGGFSRREVAALLARVLGRPAPSDLISELFARTEGVPLFLREAIRLLGERGVLEQPEKIPRSGIALPGRALDLIGRALDALS